MRRTTRDSSFFLRWVSLFFIAAALILGVFQLTEYSRTRGNYPAGLTIGGVPVGGISPAEAAERLLQVYTSPVELRYADAVIHMEPSVIGFEVDTESMLAAADLQRTGTSFWGGFWDYLWNAEAQSTNVPLIASYSEERLRGYLQDEISSRYDIPPVPALPVPGQVIFAGGTPGQELNIDRAVELIEGALRSPVNRTVNLTFQRTAPGKPGFENLEILLQQIVDNNGFDGVVGFYLLDLQNGQELHFGYDRNAEIAVVPTDIAFTASSTIKIPIMISAYRTLGPALSEQDLALVLEMVTKSENPATDAIMERIAPGRGPLNVSDDLQALGFSNTFIGGYFYDGAPLLRRYNTTANQRADVFTNPDIYNQTTPSEMGAILADLYTCAGTGGGALVAAFPGAITQAACVEMLENLKKDRIGVLLEAGVPEGTPVAHKHGWITGPGGVINNISDAGIVYTPGGDYVIVIFAYHPVQALWEPVSTMITQFSQAVYNYYNLPVQ